MDFLSENFQFFFVVKFSIYLNRRVFEMNTNGLFTVDASKSFLSP